jgi:Tfp pilus assembly protein PilV
MKTELRNYRGQAVAAFTLAEAMVAIAAGAVLLTALYGAITYSYGAIKLAREDLRATQVLVEQMEKVRLTPYANLGNFTTNVPMANGGSGTYTISLTTGTPTMAQLTPPGLSNPNVLYASSMLRITATATWTNNNIPRVRTMQTYAARNGAQGYIANHK